MILRLREENARLDRENRRLSGSAPGGEAR